MTPDMNRGYSVLCDYILWLLLSFQSAEIAICADSSHLLAYNFGRFHSERCEVIAVQVTLEGQTEESLGC